MLLIADDRERAVNVFLETLVEPDQFRIERITTGDYVFLSSSGQASQQSQDVQLDQPSQEGQPNKQIPVLIIERKSLSDLAASIKDGRMENHANLEALKAEHPALRIVYLIEGSPFTKPEKKINGIPFKTLLSQIDSLMFGGAHIVWAKNEEQTAARIVALFRRMAATEAIALANMAVGGGVVGDGVNSASNLTPAFLKKPHKKTLPMIHTDMVAVVPGVSRVTAALLLKKWSVFDLLEQKVSGEDLAAFTYQSGAKLGNRAAALTANLTPHHAKILAQIPGITEEVASAILGAIPFATLLGGFPKGSIANVTKTNGKKIGKAAEGKVVSIFEKPT